MNTIPLDNLNHEDYTASQIRLQRQQLHGGSRHSHYAASTASYYSSSNSLTAASEMQQGYYSSSQAPDDHYDSSDYRVRGEGEREREREKEGGRGRESFIFVLSQDDYDSDYSHGYSQRYLGRRYLPSLSGLSGEMSVVSHMTKFVGLMGGLPWFPLEYTFSFFCRRYNCSNIYWQLCFEFSIIQFLILLFSCLPVSHNSTHPFPLIISKNFFPIIHSFVSCCFFCTQSCPNFIVLSVINFKMVNLLSLGLNGFVLLCLLVTLDMGTLVLLMRNAHAHTTIVVN